MADGDGDKDKGQQGRQQQAGDQGQQQGQQQAGETKPDDLSDLDPAVRKALGEAGLEAIRRERAAAREAAAKAAALEEKAKRYDQLEDAKKSEEQRLREQAEEAAGKAAKAELRALKLEVALDKGLPHTMAQRLVGSTKAELESDAEKLAAELGPRRRVASGDAGAGTNGGGAGAGAEGSMDDWIRARARG